MHNFLNIFEWRAFLPIRIVFVKKNKANRKGREKTQIFNLLRVENTQIPFKKKLRRLFNPFFH